MRYRTQAVAYPYFVVALPDRWRTVERGHIDVSDGIQSWSGTGTLVTESSGEPTPSISLRRFLSW